MNISGILVYAQLERLELVRTALRSMPGVEVHATTTEGRMVVTLELPGDAEMASAMTALSRAPGVLSASLVYAHCEDFDEPSLPDQEKPS
ncbi:MAG: chaperone NapD [Betaproteobacteria bacterium]|nr:chaperone NapD [Betaproteobacteria bacterium]